MRSAFRKIDCRELIGGKLDAAILYREPDTTPIVRLVGFLSQRDGSARRKDLCEVTPDFRIDLGQS